MNGAHSVLKNLAYISFSVFRKSLRMRHYQVKLTPI